MAEQPVQPRKLSRHERRQAEREAATRPVHQVEVYASAASASRFLSAAGALRPHLAVCLISYALRDIAIIRKGSGCRS
jgi:hypothetical protein